MLHNIVMVFYHTSTWIGQRNTCVLFLLNPPPTSLSTPFLQVVTEHWLCVPHIRQQTPMSVLVTQSYLSLCDPMNCSPPASPVHGLLKERILECVAILFSKGFSQPSDWTPVPCIVSNFFTTSPTGWHRIVGAICLDSIYMCEYMISVFLFLTYFTL